MIKYFLLWFPMLLIAVINGAARDLFYIKYTGELAGHQISTFTLIILFGIYISFMIKKYPPTSIKYALKIGMLWLVLTLIFEFGFGFARGAPVETLFLQYDIFNGRLWILIPVWVTIAPFFFYKLKKP